MHLLLTLNPLPPPTPPPPAAPTWGARLPTLTMTTQASASSTLETTARVLPSPWPCCWKHGLSTPTLTWSSCPPAQSLLLQVHLLFWPCICVCLYVCLYVCLSVCMFVSYLCAPVHLCDWRVGQIALQGCDLMLHCSFSCLQFGTEFQARTEMDTL